MQTMSEQIIERRPPGWIPADTFSNRLVILRRDLGLTIDEICELIGISPATWSNWERGATPMKLTKIVERISAATKVEAEWLAFGLDQNRKQMRPRRRDRTRPRHSRPAAKSLVA